ncbi:MAG TPA: glucose 1-dehydrogenase [Candidatus Latescibacteria bacterium]|nr:glucose 1-dehydrogenase [Candidatus Latescibacterota bacterium]
MRLKDKVVVITGAGAGIGRGAALACAREGAKVVVGDIREDWGEETIGLIREEGGIGLFVPVDVGKREAIERMFDRTLDEFGRVDVLVNNAYGTTLLDDGDLLDVEEGTWDRIVGAVLKSVYLCSRRAVREMLRTGGGSVVNLSSVNALVGLGVIAYSAAKGGVIAFTRAAAVQYARHGIRFNVICPGTVESATTKPYLDKCPEVRAAVEETYPVGRVGRPEDIAPLIVYLASDESQFVTGSVFVIDGGLTAGMRFELSEFAKRLRKEGKCTG